MEARSDKRSKIWIVEVEILHYKFSFFFRGIDILDPLKQSSPGTMTKGRILPPESFDSGPPFFVYIFDKDPMLSWDPDVKSQKVNPKTNCNHNQNGSSFSGQQIWRWQKLRKQFGSSSSYLTGSDPWVFFFFPSLATTRSKKTLIFLFAYQRNEALFVNVKFLFL